MEEIQMLDAAERYIRDEMTPDEKANFEQLRNSNPDVDQMVVEHNMFLNQFEKFGALRNFKSQLNDVHSHLTESGTIKEEAPRAKLIDLITKYRRVIAVAASIGGLT